MNEVTINEWYAWAAGIVDGEGCIYLISYKNRRTNKAKYLRLVVGNIDPRMLVKLRELFGGTVRSQKSSTRPMWIWSICCRQAEVAIRAILPWLVIKREQADVALLCRALVKPLGTRRSADEEALYVRLGANLSRLKKRSFSEVSSE